MSVPKWSYDVFVSFRGEDTRNNFVSHLHYALRKSHFKVFIDEDLNRGDTLSSALVQAIETSRIAIVVVSPNFASSTWCLDELVNILQCKKSREQLVRPVFFHVDPSKMRKQTGMFEEILLKLENDFRDDSLKVKRWRLALRETAELAGWYIDRNRVEAEVVQKIVEEVSSKLRRSELSVALHPVGLEAHIQAINMLLNTNDDKVNMVAICGDGGIGKTTIAKAVYNRIADEFEGSSFLADVRETSGQYGLQKLQEALLHDVLGDTSLKVVHESVAVKLIRDRLRDKRILLILDDVDHPEHVEKLTGAGEWFGKGSKILVTIRNKNILLAQDAVIYNVHPLNDGDSLQLFSSNAFQNPYPSRDYDLMPFQFASYARGLPLALIVLGSFLNGKIRQDWIRTLNILDKVPQGLGAVSKILKVSFDGLEAHEKSIFLDIACFFNGEEISYVTKMLDRCNFYPESGLKILAERSLIYIESNKIRMHDLIQEFGREIVHQESPENPGRRSRLWYHEDVMRVLKENSGTDTVEGIKLDMLEPGELFAISKAIKKMEKLRHIIVHDLHISGCPGYLSDNIRRLDMGGDNLSNRTQSFGTIELDITEPGCALDSSVELDIGRDNLSNRTQSFSSIEHDITEPDCALDMSAGVKQCRKKRIWINIPRIRAASTRFFEFKKQSTKFRNLFSDLNFLSRYKRRQGSLMTEAQNLGIKQFSLEEIRRATNNFFQKIGHGGFGTIYHGALDNGQEVAVKRARRLCTAQGGEFLAEMKILSRMRHQNVVRLVGFYIEGSDILLIYEYMHNLSLDRYLYAAESSPLMSWTKRLKLALEIASGIEFLHGGADVSVIHGDIKPSNILLDLNWMAKVSDFGVSRLTGNVDASEEHTTITGTCGYMDPEFYFTGKLTTKSDVYSFGIVLLQLLSGHRAYYRDRDKIRRHVVDVVHFFGQDAIASVLDKNMPEPTQLEMEAVIDMASIAAECVEFKPTKRPTMTEVVGRLRRALDLCLPDAI